MSFSANHKVNQNIVAIISLCNKEDSLKVTENISTNESFLHSRQVYFSG